LANKNDNIYKYIIYILFKICKNICNSFNCHNNLNSLKDKDGQDLIKF